MSFVRHLSVRLLAASVSVVLLLGCQAPRQLAFIPGAASRPVPNAPLAQPPLPTQAVPVAMRRTEPSMGPSQAAQVVFQELTPHLYDGAGRAVRNSNLPVPLPHLNELVKPAYPARVAFRDIRVQFLPVAQFRNTPVRWQFAPYGKRLRGELPSGSRLFETPPGAATPFDRLDGNASTVVRFQLPPIGLNRGRIRALSATYGNAMAELEFAVPAVVVIDPGHGGSVNLAGSSWNNANSPSGVREKTMTLEYGRALAENLSAFARSRGLPLRVYLTRDADVNVSGRDRANLARDRLADVFVTIHFNGFNGQSRGSLQVQRGTAAGNVNLTQDSALADRLLNAVVGALKRFDSGANKRPPVALATTVSNDGYMGNSAVSHPVRHAYLEMEFIDHPGVDALLNGSNKRAVQQTVVAGMTQAIYDDLVNFR